MNEQKNDFFDVLWALEDADMSTHSPISQDENTQTHATDAIQNQEKENDIFILDDSDIFFNTDASEVLDTQEPVVSKTEEQKEPKKAKGGVIKNVVFLCKYLSTSALIFVVLLFTTNYSAYYGVISSYIFQKDFEQKSQSLLNSVQASSIVEESKEELEVSLESATVRKIKEDFNSIEMLAAKAKSAEVDLGINITPYENRIIVPKIGKNIPLIEIKQKEVEGMDELNNIFMEELENGVIRYPGSAKPGQEGNAFIFGHSSNFPWMDWDYNDVFALMDRLEQDDEIIAYYEQKKYTYKITKKEVIRPWDVSVLKWEPGSSEITLMTCWPIGTIYNRMVVVWELVNIE